MTIEDSARLARGKILLYLEPIYPASATLGLIQSTLRDAGIWESLECIKLHLCFLAARGYLQFRDYTNSLTLATLTERGRQMVNSSRVRLATITVAFGRDGNGGGANSPVDPEILWEEPC